MLYDTHCHLIYYNDEELTNVIDNIKKNKVCNLMQAGCNVNEIEKQIKICEKFNCEDLNIICGLANHPEKVRENGIITSDELITLAKTNKMIKAIGETGLDTHRQENIDNLYEQIKSFENHISAGISLKMPIIIHAYGSEAVEKSIDIITQEAKNNNFNLKFVIHCFDGNYEQAKKVVDNGGIISISGIITFKRNDHTREVIKNIPLEYIVLETDAPFLAPAPMRGRKNEPSYVKYVAEYIANYLNIDYNEICEKTYKNGIKLFG